MCYPSLYSQAEGDCEAICSHGKECPCQTQRDPTKNEGLQVSPRERAKRGGSIHHQSQEGGRECCEGGQEQRAGDAGTHSGGGGAAERTGGAAGTGQ